MRKGIALLLFLPACISVLFSQSWDNFTGSAKSYSKELIALDLNLNYIDVSRPLDSAPGQNVLVFISSREPDSLFHEILCEKLCTGFALMEYTTDRIYYTGLEYNKERIHNYLKNGKLAAAWPLFFWEPKEIEREINRGKYGRKYLLLSGLQTRLLVQSRIADNFEKLIIISPLDEILAENESLMKGKKVLWLGDKIEESQLLALSEKFGGEVKVYGRSSRGKNLLMRNTSAVDEIRSFLEK